MRRGCISLGDLQCDECRGTIPHSERYLAISSEEGVETEKIAHYCTKCAVEKGYAYYKEEKGERILTVFPKPGY